MKSKRQVEIHARLDSRSTPGIKGQGPDVDDPGEVSKSTVDYGHREEAFRYSETGGFWKRSEFLKCNRGERMRPIDEPNFFSHPNWQLARLAFNTDHPEMRS